MWHADIAKNEGPQMANHHFSHWVKTSKARIPMLDSKNSTGLGNDNRSLINDRIQYEKY